MRKLFFWSMSTVMVGVLLLSGFLWFTSFSQTEQVVVRPGTSGVWVLTSDRGRVGALLLGDQPRDKTFMFETRSQSREDADGPTLDELCDDHLLGFGLDRGVTISGMEQPAVAGMGTETGFAARRTVVPHWAIVLFAIGTLLVCWFSIGVKIYRTERGLCGNCAYDVTACSHFCPRCNKSINRKTWSGPDRPNARRRAAGF